MTEPTADYITAQSAAKRKPTELYRFWTDSGALEYKYTDGDIPVTFGGSIYSPAPIQRTGTEKDVTFDVSKMTITVANVLDSVNDHIEQIEGETIWIEVSQLLRDLPGEKQVVFIGQLSRPSFKGSTIQLECVGFEKFLSYPVPRERYVPLCNNILYGTKCGLDKADFVSAAFSIDSISTNGLTITATEIGAQTYSLARGFIVFGVHKRMIAIHDTLTSTSIGIRFAIPGLVAGSSITVYPGCDKTMDRCIALGNMGGSLDNYLGFRYIPNDNPGAWQ